MQTPVQRQRRREAVLAARLAVRAYARDPSPDHAQGVEQAWIQLRRLDGVARWQRQGEQNTVEVQRR